MATMIASKAFHHRERILLKYKFGRKLLIPAALNYQLKILLPSKPKSVAILRSMPESSSLRTMRADRTVIILRAFPSCFTSNTTRAGFCRDGSCLEL